MGDPRHRSTREAVIADVGRAITMAAGGALAFVPVEYALTLWAYSGPIELASKLRLVALVITLALWLWLVLAAATAGAMIATRLVGGLFAPERARSRGWFVPAPPVAGVRPGVPVLWATLATIGAVGAVVQRGALWADRHFQEPELTAMLVAAVALVAFALAFPLRRLFGLAAEVGAAALAPTLRACNPLGRWRAAGVACAVLVGGALAAMWFAVPQSRSVLPVRIAIAAVVVALGMGGAAGLHHRRVPGPRRRSIALAAATAALALNVLTLWRVGADLETKYVAITASPPLEHLIEVVRAANDLDRDGFGSLLGENDCAPLDREIHPGATDLPDDGIDQNCDDRDFTLRPAPAPTGPTARVPAQFERDDWNVLLITMDTVRYDRTTFGGYKDAPKHRDTTPRLAELAAKAISFTFCNAPSAGTMASIPAILTSKFFHSGIALDENVPRGTPPRIKPENTTLPELLKRAGYRTGVVASHYYWNDWGLDQGVDDYDNSIGKRNDPYIVAADRVTDHALAWISRQQGHKWFMWAHYIDPHGRYVAHPDVADYGTSEPDLYDAELRWTDQQIGRLFDELVRLPSNENTIVIVTSDHGDSMGEHTVPVGTHGTALYRELLHTPLIVYVPNNPPRRIGGAVTSLDIVPTLMDILHIDTSDLTFEGRSLVPQIFYGREDHDRIVFSETNAPSPERAAISEAWKLIFYMHANLYELYDLKADPWEKKNLAPRHPAAMTLMKAALDAWLERVVYARDPRFNQANERIADLVLPAAPRPEIATSGQTLGGGTLQILGAGLAAKSPRPAPGARVELEVYFKAAERTDVEYRFQLAAWPVDTATWHPTDPAPPTLQRSRLRLTGDGFFPSNRWRAGEYIRDRFAVTLPASWQGNGIAIGLVAADTHGGKAAATGAAPANDPNLLVLGVLPLGSMPPPAP